MVIEQIQHIENIASVHKSFYSNYLKKQNFLHLERHIGTSTQSKVW
jgi:hypothetical protein